jgi:hypothetical protein
VRIVIETAVTLAKIDGKNRLEGDFMLMAIIIYYVQRREHRFDEIVEKLKGVERESKIKKIVMRLEQKGQLVKSGEIYRIAPNLGSLQVNIKRSMNDF